MSHRHKYLDLYCCLSHEYFIAYPQPRLSPYHEQKTKNKYRNTNAFKPTSSIRLSKYKPKNSIHSNKILKDHYGNDTHNYRREKMNKIMSIESIDQDVEFYMIKESTRSVKRHSSQLADGDKKNENFQQNMIDIIRSIPCKSSLNNRSKPSSTKKSFKNLMPDLSSSQISQSILSLNRTLSWNKLQASSHDSHVHHPIMLSPSNKQQSITENLKSKSLSVDSSTNLTDSDNTNHRIIQSTTEEDQQVSDDNSNSNKIKLLKNDSFTNKSIHNTLSLQEIEIISSSQVPSNIFNDILSSFFPMISTPLTLTLQSTLDHSSTLFIESIKELCLLIRQLLQHELIEEKKTSLQSTIANQLAILLTYLAIPKNENFTSSSVTKDTVEKMTSTNEDDIYPEEPLLFTIGTQTDLESIHDLIEFDNQNKEEKILDILSSQKVTSHTELISNSVTLCLPGRRLNHALSDTFIYHINHHQQYSFSSHHLNSFSETNIYSLIKQNSTKEKIKYLLKHFQHFIELKSSNTCLEGSTEFTPDFILTTINNTKYDQNDQTEQFGIDTDTISLIIKKNQEKIDTLTFNSTEKENYDSLELDIEQDNEEHSLFTSFDNYQSEKHFCELLQPLLNTSQWQLPILPRKTNSSNSIYEKRMAKIDLKHMRIRSNSNNNINIIGKRVRIKSNSSSRTSIPTTKSHSSQQQSKMLYALNYNNNYNKHADSIQSLELSTSIADTRLSSATIDSLSSINSNSLDNNNTDQSITNRSKSDELIAHSSLLNIHQSDDNLIRTTSSSATFSSYSLDVNDKLGSNIALAQNLLNMLDSYNNNSSTMKISLLHMYIRQFLIQFDARIRLGRIKKMNSTNKHINILL